MVLLVLGLALSAGVIGILVTQGFLQRFSVGFSAGVFCAAVPLGVILCVPAGRDLFLSYQDQMCHRA